MNHTRDLLQEKFKIDERVLSLIEEAEAEVSPQFKELDDIMAVSYTHLYTQFGRSAQSDNLR